MKKAIGLRVAGKSPFSVFRIRREERGLALLALIVFSVLNALTIASHWQAYTKGAHAGFWSIFMNRFRISGYDCFSWLTISEGRIDFQTIRHPLYVTFLYPMHWLNQGLVELTGVNFSVFMMAIVLVAVSTYAVLFFYRIMHEVVGVARRDALLLTALLFSFAHVLVATMVPDHFAISLFLLLLLLYIAGKCMLKGITLKPWQGFVLAFFTGGMASSNIVKAFLAGLFVNGRRFFRPRYLLVGVLLPVALLLAVRQVQYHTLEVPLAEKNARVVKANAKKADPKKLAAHEAWSQSHGMQRAAESGLLKLMDFSTPRVATLVDNYFGEGFQLHSDHALEDVFHTRPVFVSYRWAGNDVVEVLIVALFLAGVVVGSRRRFFRLILSWYALDATLTLVLGFAVNEVYILTSGWAFIIPVGLGYALLRLHGRWRQALRGLAGVLAVFLWAWNLTLIVDYLA